MTRNQALQSAGGAALACGPAAVLDETSMHQSIWSLQRLEPHRKVQTFRSWATMRTSVLAALPPARRGCLVQNRRGFLAGTHWSGPLSPAA